jgi:predicted DNA-binding transcriptional regulator YafY
MSKRPDTLETIHVALELLRRIPRGRKISAPELHAQLNEAGLARDLRTIQRQLEMLTEHFDIERDDRSRPYGYCWKERAKGISLPCLTEQESLLLTLAEQHLRNLLPASLMNSMEGFFTQARANIAPHTDAKREREWLSKVRVVSETQPLLPPKISSKVFEEVSNALYANRWLEVDYKNASGKCTQREVMPLGLAQQGPRIYLVCRFPGFDNERSLALHRITSARALTRIFERPKDFDLQKYDDDGRFGFGEGKRIKITFQIDKTAGFHLLESPLSMDQEVVELNDVYKITATVVDSEWLWRWVRGFGSKISDVSILDS